MKDKEKSGEKVLLTGIIQSFPIIVFCIIKVCFPGAADLIPQVLCRPSFPGTGGPEEHKKYGVRDIHVAVQKT